jgi:A/G-specific adenine glycosylase
VNQGLQYYLEFIKRFPTLKKLAEASLDEVLKAWQGLGYYTRARNLHATARYIYYDNKCQFPDSYNELIKLQGIGDYTASAIASFAFEEPVAVVDGNVQRVISRLKGIATPVNTTDGKKIFKKEAQKLLDHHDPGEYNQAIIELGALVCTPKNPECEYCPLKMFCHAYQNNGVKEFPVKIKKGKKKNRYFYYLEIRYKNQIFIHKRTRNDIWNSLYQFPLIESGKKLSLQELTGSERWKEIFDGLTPTIEGVSEYYIHQLTHQKIHACFVEIEIPQITEFIQKKYLATNKNKIHNFAVPRLIGKYLEKENS